VTNSDTHIISGDFEKLYMQLREKEGRVYSDKEVVTLPDLYETHPHYSEWRMRKQSCQKLISYLHKQQTPLKILEVGCGNGWLAHQLADVPGSKVIGTDINFTELQQAAKVFKELPNLHFIYTDIESGLFEERQFDIIVFAASIQYFSSLNKIIGESMRLLKPNGEIHIIDSHFYSLTELNAAKQRSLLYYQSAGFPELADWYFHHSFDELRQFDYSTLYDPQSVFNRFLQNKNPFPWIRIQQ